MATISLTIPDAQVPRLKEAAEANFDRPEGMADGPFYKYVISQIIEDWARQYFRNKAAAAAQAPLDIS